MRPFSDLANEMKNVGAFEGLEAKELIVEIALVHDGRVERWRWRSRRAPTWVAVQTAVSGLGDTCARDLRPTIAQPQQLNMSVGEVRT